MKVLIVHQNFPGQYLHLARHLGATRGNEVVFITQRKDANLPGVKKLIYKAKRESTRGVHHYIKEAEAAVLNAQEVARARRGQEHAGVSSGNQTINNSFEEHAGVSSGNQTINNSFAIVLLILLYCTTHRS